MQRIRILKVNELLSGKRETKERKGFNTSFISNQLSKQKNRCYRCQKRFHDQVGKPQKHHKDGNRSNPDPKNLVLVCAGCHEWYTDKKQVERAKKNQKKSQRQRNSLIGDLKFSPRRLKFP